MTDFILYLDGRRASILEFYYAIEEHRIELIRVDPITKIMWFETQI